MNMLSPFRNPIVVSLESCGMNHAAWFLLHFTSIGAWPRHEGFDQHAQVTLRELHVTKSETIDFTKKNLNRTLLQSSSSCCGRLLMLQKCALICMHRGSAFLVRCQHCLYFANRKLVGHSANHGLPSREERVPVYKTIACILADTSPWYSGYQACSGDPG